MIQKKIIIDTDPAMGIKGGDSENGNHLHQFTQETARNSSLPSSFDSFSF